MMAKSSGKQARRSITAKGKKRKDGQVPPVAGPSALELAQPLIERAELSAVLLVESTATRTPEADTDFVGSDIKIKVENVEIQPHLDNGRFVILLTFVFEAREISKEDSVPFLAIIAKYAVLYECAEMAALTDQNYRGFARASTILTAWPYWREYAMGMCHRMGFRPKAMPLFRV